MRTKSFLPVLNANLLTDSIEQRKIFSEYLLSACHQIGSFYLAQHPISTALCDQVLEKSHEFFSLPLAHKSKIHINGSSHFRGYSQMKNERDWREQVHLGLEIPAIDSNSSTCQYHKLQGSNLWLPQLSNDWQEVMLAFLSAVETLSQTILSVLAWELGLPENYFAIPVDQTPYLLMKLICYHPQLPQQSPRVGVAAHCD